MHISQLADEFVANCEDHVKEGDTVSQPGTSTDTTAGSEICTTSVASATATKCQLPSPLIHELQLYLRGKFGISCVISLYINGLILAYTSHHWKDTVNIILLVWIVPL